MTRSRSVRRAGRQKPAGLNGFVVTWDVDSRDASQCARVRRFIFGYTLRPNGRAYRYPGFVERDGVRYLGQSVLFVTSDRLTELLAFLRIEGVIHVVMQGSLGAVMPN